MSDDAVDLIVFLINIAAAIANVTIWVSLRAAKRRAAWQLKWVSNARIEAIELLEAALAMRRGARHDRDTWKFARMASDATTHSTSEEGTQ
jgi:hypothetical protein